MDEGVVLLLQVGLPVIVVGCAIACFCECYLDRLRIQRQYWPRGPPPRHFIYVGDERRPVVTPGTQRVWYGDPIDDEATTV